MTIVLRHIFGWKTCLLKKMIEKSIAACHHHWVLIQIHPYWSTLTDSLIRHLKVVGKLTKKWDCRIGLFPHSTKQERWHCSTTSGASQPSPDPNWSATLCSQWTQRIPHLAKLIITKWLLRSKAKAMTLKTASNMTLKWRRHLAGSGGRALVNHHLVYNRCTTSRSDSSNTTNDSRC